MEIQGCIDRLQAIDLHTESENTIIISNHYCLLTDFWVPAPGLNNQMQLVVSFNPFKNSAKSLYFYHCTGVGTETHRGETLAKARQRVRKWDLDPKLYLHYISLFLFPKSIGCKSVPRATAYLCSVTRKYPQRAQRSRYAHEITLTWW